MNDKKEINGVKCRTEKVKETTERIITWYTCDNCGHEENSIDSFYICDEHGVYCNSCAKEINNLFKSCPKCYDSIKGLKLMDLAIIKQKSGYRTFFEIVGFRGENIKVKIGFLHYFLSRSKGV